jgi:hypothetical protein
VIGFRGSAVADSGWVVWEWTSWGTGQVDTVGVGIPGKPAQAISTDSTASYPATTRSTTSAIHEQEDPGLGSPASCRRGHLLTLRNALFSGLFSMWPVAMWPGGHLARGSTVVVPASSALSATPCGCSGRRRRQPTVAWTSVLVFYHDVGPGVQTNV